MDTKLLHWLSCGLLIIFSAALVKSQDDWYVINEEVYFLDLSENVTESSTTIPVTSKPNVTREIKNQTSTPAFPRLIDTTHTIPDLCFEPMNRGLICQSRMVRYYYNYTLNQCLEFEYVGCFGNDNRFRLREECESTCMSKDITIDPRFTASAPMTCRLSIHILGGCQLTSDRSRIVSCASYPSGRRHEHDHCLSLGCCWHHSYKLCYNYANETIENVGCKIYASDRSRFYTYSQFQTSREIKNGWVGYLTFNFPVTGEFCMIRNRFFHQYIIVGERFMANRGTVLQGTKYHYAGDYVEILTAATLGSTKISVRCERYPRRV